MDLGLSNLNVCVLLMSDYSYCQFTKAEKKLFLMIEILLNVFFKTREINFSCYLSFRIKTSSTISSEKIQSEDLIHKTFFTPSIKHMISIYERPGKFVFYRASFLI
jgi:hypothetical protein